MSLVVPSVGAIELLEELVLGADWQPYYRLYTNPGAPNPNTILEDFTEATFAGYTPLLATGWIAADIDDSGRAFSLGNLLTWTRGVGGAGQNVYGYFVTQGNPGPLIFAQRFVGAPYVMTTPGQVITVLPTFTLKTEFTS